MNVSQTIFDLAAFSDRCKWAGRFNSLADRFENMTAPSPWLAALEARKVTLQGFCHG
jgi:hypothetical protein